MASISTRRLDSNHDPINGNGLADFAVDLEAVTILIECTLLLFQGEFWMNTQAGIPLTQGFLGQASTSQARNAFAMALQTAILGVPFVSSLSDVLTSWDSAERAFSFTCTANTAFGPISVTYPPVTGGQ